MKTKQDYRDILDLPYEKSKRHPHMPVHDRAAQFSPFAALTGYEDAIDESGRQTDRRIELSEEEREILDRQWQELELIWKKEPCVATVTYFVPDLLKAGGKYETVSGTVTKLDAQVRNITLDRKYIIPVSDIVSLYYRSGFPENNQD